MLTVEMKEATVQQLKQMQFYNEYIELNEIELQRMSDLYERLVLADSRKVCSYARIMDKVKDIEQKIMSDTETRVTQRESILAAIDKMDDPTQAALIKLRYLDGRTWKDIGYELHYTEAGISKKHNAALASVYRCLCAVNKERP